MTGRDDKNRSKKPLSLSKSQKRGGRGAGRAPTTPPITSFFTTPVLGCPLCGHVVPRLSINHHLDFQCQNFERSESSPHPPREDTPRPKPSQSTDQAQVKGQTSPYFKDSDVEKTSTQGTAHRGVVRVLNLGRLSSRLSRRRQKVPEETQNVDGDSAGRLEDLCSETLDSSQKENARQTFEDARDGVTAIDLTAGDAEAAAAPEVRSGTGREESRDRKAPGTREEAVAPNPKSSSSSSSTSGKRKTAFSSKASGSRKKAKRDRARGGETEEASRPESTTETAHQEGLKTKELRTHDLPLCSEGDVNAEKAGTDGAESVPADRDANTSQPTRLPYYLQNFRTVLEAVLENEDDRALFDQRDMSHIRAFEKLSGMMRHHRCGFFLG